MDKTHPEDLGMATQVEIDGKLFKFAPVDTRPIRAAYADSEPISVPEPSLRVKLGESRNIEDYTKPRGSSLRRKS